MLLRNPVQISDMGRPDWTSTLQAAQLKLTLKNDGRFTPKLAAGAYFPNVTRNVQIRVSVNAQAAAPLGTADGTFESGVSTWLATGGTFAQSSAQAHSGTKSGLLTTSGSPSQTIVRPAFANAAPVTAGTSYTAGGWLYSAAGYSSAGFAIDWYTSGNVYLSTSSGTTAAIPAGQWTFYQVTGTAPATAAFGEYGPTIGGTPPNGTAVFLDDAAMAPAASVYSGFRFWGEVAEWPESWNAAGRDVHSDITANGIWRRMQQLQTTLGSAYTRYNSITLTGTSAPRAYWPMEDGVGSGQLVSYDSVAGTGNAVQSFVTGQAGLSLAACTDFKGSDGIPQLNAAKITATVPAGGTATNNVTRFLISVPKAGDSASGTTNWNLAEINSAGTIAKYEVYLNAAGTLLVQLRNSGGTVIASGTTTTNVKGMPVLASCELTPSGGNVAWAFRIITPGAAGITESMTGTVTTASVGAVSTVVFGRANVLMDTAVGHLSVTYGAVPLMVPAAYALAGYSGEFAMDRFTRICGEMGITAETIGTASSTAAMGPQIDATLTDVMQSIEDADMGLLFESRTQFGLGYRSLASMANQAAAAAISYTAGILDLSLAPVFDDAQIRNNVTVVNQSTGYTQQALLTAGPMSINNPPNGVGNGYTTQRTVNAASDTQIAGIANWLLNIGSVDEIRFPVITVKLAKAAAAGLFAAVPGIRPGDYLQITSPPAFLTASTIKQLAFGYTETIGVNRWDFAFNTVPESPYETGFSPGTVQTAQLPGSGAVTSTAPGAGGLGGIIANGSITPSMLNGGITVKTLGGNRTTISASAPSNPDTNDIWIASATGLISQWNGSSWVPFKFDGSATIQAGTIVASNIAASTITAGLLAAGIVVSGIVDATNVFASTYVATNAAGEFLAYDGAAPATGHLINAIAGSAGTDSQSNPYPIGFYGQQLTLASQSSAPTAFSGSSILYTSSQGRLRYLSSTGNDLVLDRCVLELTNYSMGTQTIPHILSGTLNYLADEAQVGSEYELEIDGTITTPSGTSAQFAFDLYVDGAAFSAASSITVGTNIIQTGLTYAFTLRFRATVEVTGASGHCTVAADGSMTRKDFNVGNTANQFATLNDVNVNCAFDTTANHSLAIYCNWSSTAGTGHSAITYRTRKTRRN